MPSGWRKKSEFRRAGSVRVGELPLPRVKGRQLELQRAWIDAVGPAVAQKVRAVAVRRGIVELRVDDERWQSAVGPMLPELAARLQARHPELGLSRYRTSGAGAEQRAARPIPVIASDSSPDLACEAAPARETTAAVAGSLDAVEPRVRLRELAERYLEAARSRD